METKKMTLANVQGKLSRAEMKKVMAGDEDDASHCMTQTACSVYYNGNVFYGECNLINGSCLCSTDLGYYIPSSNGGVSRCGG